MILLRGPHGCPPLGKEEPRNPQEDYHGHHGDGANMRVDHQEMTHIWCLRMSFPTLSVL